jgi:hypothetical protein
VDEKDLVAAAMKRLALPAMRTQEPLVIVAFGGRAQTDDFFDVLTEFFPLVYVSKVIVGDLTPALLAGLCLKLAKEGMCPFIEVGDVHHSHFTDLTRANLPIHLIWVAEQEGQVSHSGRDRMEWLMSALGKKEFFLVDPSQDLYPQAFSLPFLPGARR